MCGRAYSSNGLLCDSCRTGIDSAWENDMAKKSSETVHQSVDDPDIRANDPPKPAESKADRFRRLANKRVPAAVKRIGHVANLANRNQYEYTDEQRDKILTAIKDAVARLTTAFSGSKAESNGWSL
jgi:hypothetical protein